MRSAARSAEASVCDVAPVALISSLDIWTAWSEGDFMVPRMSFEKTAA
jgi:hypothetical protein